MARKNAPVLINGKRPGECTVTELFTWEIETAYAKLTKVAKLTGFAVRLSDLRDLAQGAETNRWAFDKALIRMAERPGVHIRAEADQKTLTERDRAAAIILGGTERHTLLIEP